MVITKSLHRQRETETTVEVECGLSDVVGGGTGVVRYFVIRLV